MIDECNYTVVCAGVRYANLTEKQARAQAESIVREWATVGPRRVAKIFYRDGSQVGEIGYSDLFK